MRKLRRLVALSFVLALALALSACAEPAAGPGVTDFSGVDFEASPYKHLNNGGVTADPVMPYNVDAITGATVTVEGPGVVSSIPLSVRELENRNAGLFRGLYADSAGERVYEGLDLHYLLSGMVEGDNGIFLTDSAYSVQLKNANRETLAVFKLAEVAQAHEEGRPILLAYGVGTADETLVAPFVFDAANPSERSAGYVAELQNDDGCIRLVYDLERYGANPDYTTFSNAAYVYLGEESEPGFKHTGEESVYSASRYADYIVTFRGEALGAELDFTLRQLEALVAYDEEGRLEEGGVGYSGQYSLANNAYWYVNEYEGLDLYKLLLYLGMADAEELGLAAARTTLVSFVAADGVAASESFSVDTLSYPDAFGFYKKNAADLGDGTYKPSNADLADTGYPVLLAYGVNRYPYTITKADEGYLSGLANSGGPLRVVFGKTQYNHANGSNQVQYLKDVIVGADKLYNTHAHTDVAAHQALAANTLAIRVTGEDGGLLLERTMTVGEIEDILYGGEVSGNIFQAAQVKDSYEVEVDGAYRTAIYEGVGLQYLLMNVLGLPGTSGTATFAHGRDEVTVNLDALFRTGYNPGLGRSGLPAVLAFAKNGAPMVSSNRDAGYVAGLPLNSLLPNEPSSYSVDNSGGPLALLIPSTGPDSRDAITLQGLTAIQVQLVPDAYAHIQPPYNAYAENSIRFYGDGLEAEKTYSVGELESKQIMAKTLDYSVQSNAGELKEQRFRGLALYDLFIEIGIKSNAGDVTVHTADGGSHTFSLSQMKRKNYLNYLAPEKPPLSALLAFGAGTPDSDVLQGLPLVAAQSSSGYDEGLGNDGGPLRLIIPQEDEDSANGALCLKNVVGIEVGANEIEAWGHRMSDVFGEFLAYEFTFTVRNDEAEWSHTFTVGQLEEMSDLIVRENYSVLDVGECEGIVIWKLVQRFAGDVPGIDDPVSVIVYAEDGYKNDLLSVFYKEGLELGAVSEDGERKPLIIAYAINGLPLVDTESHEGYTGLAGNTAGPLRTVAEGNQGASVKQVNKLVVTVPGAGSIEEHIDKAIFPAE
ncbi:MAG: hypothetical protein LBS10_10270 [Gracilibacteraceae bacterium]|jgi:hypothetical protein|nr:hypothetical protein [Gracilibacteraceae bacterium]